MHTLHPRRDGICAKRPENEGIRQGHHFIIPWSCFVCCQQLELCTDTPYTKQYAHECQLKQDS